MTIPEFLASLPAGRQELMNTLHETIIANDPNVTFAIKPMMGKEMIMYEEGHYMKYALASAKSHMSLHCLPIYMNAPLHAKYAGLLPAAKFQKGCINFTDAATMPVAIVAALIDNDQARQNYINNFENTLHVPKNNNFSLKILYYIDYQSLRKHKKASRKG
jgi:hypothetical protein